MSTRHSSQAQGESLHRIHGRLLGTLLLGMLIWPLVACAAADTWTGLGLSDNWSDPNNWLDGSSPLSTDSVVFNATDSGNTSIIDLDFFTLNPTGEIAGLQYTGNGIHTTDFAGSSDLQVNGPVYIGYGGSADGATITWANGGSVQIGDSLNLRAFYIGANTSSSTVLNTASLLLDGPVVDAHVSDLSIGRKMNTSGYATADGSLILGSSSSMHVGTTASPGVVNVGMNQSTDWSGVPLSGGDGTGLLDATQGNAELHLSELNVGLHTGYYGTATGSLRWDQLGPIDADKVYFGRGPSTGILDVPIGGTLLLGTLDNPLSLLGISYHDTGYWTPTHVSAGASNAALDFTVTDPAFEVFTSNLTIGAKMHTVGRGTANGSLILGDNSGLHVGTTAAPGVANIGMNQSTAWSGIEVSGGDGTGLLDATQGNAELHLSELNVGLHTGYYGTATGTLRWDQAGPIDADRVYFGRGPSTGILDVPIGGTLLLGTAADPLSLLGISYHDTGRDRNTAGTSSAHLDFTLTNPVFEAFTSNLTVGAKMSAYGYGTANGSLTLGDNSSLHVGTAAAPGVVDIGMNQSTDWSGVVLSGGDGTGLLDATQGNAELHLSELNVGRHKGYYGTATGTLRWDQAGPIDADRVYFGRGPSTGILDVPVGGTLLLGTGADPLSLLAISYHDTGRDRYTAGASSAHLDFTLTDPAFEAFTSSLTIGGKMSAYGYGTADGSLTLGDNSSLHVGTAGTPGVVTIGVNQSTDWSGIVLSGGDGTGLLDATQGSAELHLSELNVGLHTGYYGTATGTLRWDQAGPIDADRVYFGRGPSTGILDVPTGGTLLLGTAADPLSLLGISYHDRGRDRNTAGTSSAHLDFTLADPVFEAFTSNLTIGGKMNAYGYGTANGSLILGDNSSLHVGTLATPGIVNVGMNQSTGWAGVPLSGGDGTGLLDATQGNAELHLSELNVGRHRGYYGTTTGTFTTGDGSVVTTTTANVGTTSGGIAKGTVNLQGGLFSANTINLGSGGDFNFTGGRLGLGTFNTYGGIGALEQEGGVLAPGFSRTQTSLAGQAVINGDYLLDSLGTLEIELFGTEAGAEYDQLRVFGDVDLNADLLAGGTLDLILQFSPEIGDEFLIIDNDALDAVSGCFSGLDEGDSFSRMFMGSWYTFEISYLGYTGNDVVLRTIEGEPPTTIPAPGAIVLAVIGAGIVSRLQRRRLL